MAKRPAFQFYPGDWRRSLDVQALSFHDRGVWFEILCLMHESEERGVLMLAGKPMSDEILAKNLNISAKKLQKTLKILLELGVAERNEDGALINRRMIRDNQLSTIRKENGKLGGNPKLLGNSPPILNNHKDNQIVEEEDEEEEIKKRKRVRERNDPYANPVNQSAHQKLLEWTGGVSRFFGSPTIQSVAFSGRWEQVCIQAIDSGLTLEQFLAVLTDEYQENIRYATPERVLQKAQASRAKQIKPKTKTARDLINEEQERVNRETANAV